MADLKLARLPDRTLYKVTISLGPDLNAALKDYADLYAETYGEKEDVAELIPFMLERFLETDRAFSRKRKGRSG